LADVHLVNLVLYLFLVSLFSFSLTSSPPHQDLHSFPTRRSSDLTTKELAYSQFAQLEVPALTWAIFEVVGPFPETLQNTWGKDRSEEHTSELQSRFDLVCRLLLEKKKKKRQNVQNT